MPTRKLMYRRQFLNRRGQHSGAHAIAIVEVVHNPKKDRTHVEGSLRLADCYRVIELDFRVFDLADAKNSLHKAKLLRELIGDFSDKLEKATEQWESER